VPLIVHGPGFRGGAVRREFASLLDIPPTFLAAAGAKVPAAMRGRPLQDTLRGPADWRKEVFVQISEAEVGRAIRTPRWTYAVRAPQLKGGEAPASDVYVETYLYDNERDPHQRNNLVKEVGQTEVRAELRATLLRYLREVEQAVPEIKPAT
jgi:arylsulfatase A-like enzyme